MLLQPTASEAVTISEPVRTVMMSASVLLTATSTARPMRSLSRPVPQIPSGYPGSRPGRKATQPNIDAGVDFGMGVTFEIVNKHMSRKARSGDMAAFKTDVDQAVITKAGQLDGTAALLWRTPQPPASPLKAPADNLPLRSAAA